MLKFKVGDLFTMIPYLVYTSSSFVPDDIMYYMYTADISEANVQSFIRNNTMYIIPRISNCLNLLKVDSTIFNYTYNINNNLSNHYINIPLLNISTNVYIF